MINCVCSGSSAIQCVVIISYSHKKVIGSGNFPKMPDNRSVACFCRCCVDKCNRLSATYRYVTATISRRYCGRTYWRSGDKSNTKRFGIGTAVFPQNFYTNRTFCVTVMPPLYLNLSGVQYRITNCAYNTPNNSPCPNIYLYRVGNCTVCTHGIAFCFIKEKISVFRFSSEIGNNTFRIKRWRDGSITAILGYANSADRYHN